MAAVNEVALSVVDLSSMSAAQQNCEDVSAHRAGHHPAKSNLNDHERLQEFSMNFFSMNENSKRKIE